MPSSRTDIVIVLDRVSIEYKTSSGTVEALKNISLSIYEGEFVSIIGPSGCGKSTLLNLLASILEPSSGSIRMNTKEATRSFVSFVFQEGILLPWRNVAENVRLPLEILKVAHQKLMTEPLEYLNIVGLGDFAKAYPKELSGGMKQRVAIARALVSDPKLLLMDEPFSALDELSRLRINMELQDIWLKTGKTIVFVTHNINEAVFLSDRVIVLTERPGRIANIIDICMPRARTIDAFSSQEFFSKTSLVRKHLYNH